MKRHYLNINVRDIIAIRVILLYSVYLPCETVSNSIHTQFETSQGEHYRIKDALLSMLQQRSGENCADTGVV